LLTGSRKINFTAFGFGVSSISAIFGIANSLFVHEFGVIIATLQGIRRRADDLLFRYFLAGLNTHRKKFAELARIVAKKQKQEYTPALTCPPLRR
jgi:hypothetical protein